MLASCGKQCKRRRIAGRHGLPTFHKLGWFWTTSTSAIIRGAWRIFPRQTRTHRKMRRCWKTKTLKRANSWTAGSQEEPNPAWRCHLVALPFIGAPCSSSTMFGWRQRLTACEDDLPKARCSMILTRLAVGKNCYAIITRDFFVLAVSSSHVSYLLIPSENRCSPCQILMHFQG